MLPAYNTQDGWGRGQRPAVEYPQANLSQPGASALTRSLWVPRTAAERQEPPRAVLGGSPVQQREFTLTQDVPGVGSAGERVMLAVTPADTSDQYRELDTYLGGYVPWGMDVDFIAPVVLVDKETGKRRDFDVSNAFEVVETRTGRSGAINEIKHLTSSGTYETEEHALAAYIPWASENDAEPLYKVKEAHSEMIGWKLGLARAVRTLAIALSTGSWNANNHTTLTTNFYWDTGSTKNPRLNLHTRLNASAQKVTGIVMNPDVAFWFLSDTEVRTYLRQMMGDAALSPDIAKSADTQGITVINVVGYPPITVFPGKRVPAAGGALEYMMGDDVLLLSNPSGSHRDGRSVASFWTYRTKGPSGTGITTQEYVPMGRGIERGTMLEQGYKETVFSGSNIAGGLIKNVLS